MNKGKWFAVVLVCALSGCGFHLKGAPTGGLALAETDWQIDGGVLQQPLEQEMRYVLGRNTAFSGSVAKLQVVSVAQQKDIYTITRAAKLNEYLLSLNVSAQAYRYGQKWGEPMNVQVRRTMPYADSMILGKAEEEQIIWQEMHRDAAQQIVRRLAFLRDYPTTTVLP